MEYRMAKLTLYHAAPSRSSITRWMLEEVGEPYDIHLLNLSRGDTHTPDYLAVNPMGKVPALKPAAPALPEGPAFWAYSPADFPRPKPAGPLAPPRRAVFFNGLFFVPTSI